MRYDPHAPLVVCSPHFDDAVLDCWTVLTRPGPCEIVNVFSARPQDGYATWWDQLAGAKSSAEMHRDRIREDLAALALAGRTAHMAGLLDGQYRLRASRLLHALILRKPALRWRLEGVPLLRHWAVTSPAPTAHQIVTALTSQVAAASLVCVPAAIGRHPDHVLLRDAALKLVDQGVPVRLYADLPYCIQHGWPRWVSGQTNSNDAAIDSLWRSDLGDVVDSLQSAVIVTLTPQQQETKRAAVGCYRSQLSTAGSGFREMLLGRDSFRYELYWQITT
jgi:LmbE family N-acetylglucosaminyl deacetylase